MRRFLTTGTGHGGGTTWFTEDLLLDNSLQILFSFICLERSYFVRFQMRIQMKRNNLLCIEIKYVDVRLLSAYAFSETVL